MSYVAGMLDLYRTKIGAAPANLTDLNEREFEKDCSIYSDHAGAFAVTCGLPRPASGDVAAFMPHATFVRKFHALGRSEILYLPAPKC